MSRRRLTSCSILRWFQFRAREIFSYTYEWPAELNVSSAGFHVYAEFVMSSLDSGSTPTISMRALTRRVISVPTLTWAWRRTMSRAATTARGRLMGSFSRRWTMDCTSSAWNVVYADLPVAMAWNTTNASAPRTSPTIRYWGRCRRAAMGRSNMSISPAALPVETDFPPNPARVSRGTQFSWGG